jgi:aryl-alcohol dehydrogenase-like predicted oxidoreductase
MENKSVVELADVSPLCPARPRVPQLDEFARGELGVSVGQLAVARSLANPAVRVAIVGTRDPEHVKETLLAADLELDGPTLSRIDTIMRDATPLAGPSPASV